MKENNIKKIAGILAVMMSAAAMFSGCGNTVEDTGANDSGGGTSSVQAADNSASDNSVGNTGSDNNADTPSAVNVTDYRFGKIDIPGKDGALCGAPIYIAYENGYFAEEGFDVTLISADTETRKIGLNNGSIPIINGDFQFFPSIENGVNTKVVEGLHDGCIKIAVRPDSDIQTVEDLKGKKIGVDEIGGTPHQVASVWLEQAGISANPSDGEITFLPYSDGNLEFQALADGTIDAAALWDPLGSIKEKAGDVKIIFDLSTQEGFAGKYCCFLYASSKVIDEEPEKVSALLRAYHKAQNFIYENPEETADIIINKKYSSIEDRDLAIELIKSYGYPSSDTTTGASQERAKDNVLYFVRALKDIGYLTTDDPDGFAADIFADIDLTLGADAATAKVDFTPAENTDAPAGDAHGSHH